MKNYFILLVWVLAFQNCIGQERALIDAVVTKYKSHKTMSYKCEYKHKYFDYNDTLTIAADNRLIKREKDTLFGMAMWLDTKIEDEHLIYYYENEKLFNIDFQTKKTIFFDSAQDQKPTVEGRTQNGSRNVFFLKPEYIIKMVSEPTNSVNYKHVKFKGMDELLVEINLPDEEQITKYKIKIWIDELSYIINKFTIQMNLQDQVQFQGFTLSDVKFDDFQEKDLARDFEKVKNLFPIDTFSVMLSRRDSRPLLTHQEVPDLKGKYTDGRDFDLTTSISKPVLLDFWFVGCMPCELSTPQLSALQNKYQGRIEVFGINPYIGDKKQIENIPAYIKRTGMTYPIILSDYSVSEMYCVHSFPTVYLVDKKGIVRRSWIGYSEEHQVEMDDAVSDLLKEN